MKAEPPTSAEAAVSSEGSGQNTPLTGFEDLLAANSEYAASFAYSGFDGIAHAGIGVVTCMDSRIPPLEMLEFPVPVDVGPVLVKLFVFFAGGEQLTFSNCSSR